MERRGLKDETAGTPFKPDEGWDYNPGLARWEPDLTKYAPDARRILQTSKVGHPQNMPALAERFTRMRDELRKIGVAGSPRPIRIVRITDRRYNGWARWETGEIGIRGDFHDAVQAALKKGEAATAGEVDAFKTLVHEMGHHLGAPLGPRYFRDEAYRATLQTVNDLWARHATGPMMQVMGLRYPAKEVARLVDYHPSYQGWVERLRAILDGAGLDEVAQKELVNTLNLTVDPEWHSRVIWDAIRKEKPRIVAEGEIGDYLVNERRFSHLMQQLATWN